MQQRIAAEICIARFVRDQFALKSRGVDLLSHTAERCSKLHRSGFMRGSTAPLDPTELCGAVLLPLGGCLQGKHSVKAAAGARVGLVKKLSSRAAGRVNTRHCLRAILPAQSARGQDVS
jgi:hypothetical protein